MMRIVFSIIFMLTGQAYSSSKKIKPLKTFDIYASPFVGLSFGDYQADTADKGDLMNYHYGGRLGFKVGPVLFGGEFSTIEMSRDSKQSFVSATNQVKYAVDQSGDMTSIGVNLGLTTDRLTLIATLFPASKLEVKNDVPGNLYKNSYYGSTQSVELNIRVWDRLYVGVYGAQSEFTDYSTNHSSGTLNDADLSPKLKMSYSGIMINYLVPLTELSKVSLNPKSSKK